MDRVVTLTGLYKRKRFRTRRRGNRFLNELAARMEFRPVAQAEYDRYSIPQVQSVAREGVRDAGRASARAGARGASPR